MATPPSHESKDGISLVATVLSIHNDVTAAVTLREFLASHLAKYIGEKTLKHPSASDPLMVTEYAFTFQSSRAEDLRALRSAAYEWGRKVNVDVAIQLDDVFRRHKQLVVFDMDSTLIKQEVIDEIALHLDQTEPEKNVAARVAVYTSSLVGGADGRRPSPRRRCWARLIFRSRSVRESNSSRELKLPYMKSYERKLCSRTGPRSCVRD